MVKNTTSHLLEDPKILIQVYERLGWWEQDCQAGVSGVTEVGRTLKHEQSLTLLIQASGLILRGKLSLLFIFKTILYLWTNSEVSCTRIETDFAVKYAVPLFPGRRKGVQIKCSHMHTHTTSGGMFLADALVLVGPY